MSQLRVHLGIFAGILTLVGGILVYQTAKASAVADLGKDVAVNCGPTSQAIVRQAPGQSHVVVDCVDAGSLAAANTGLQTWLGGYQNVAAPGSAPVVVPAVYTVPAPVAPVLAAPVAQRQTVSQTRTNATRTVERRSKPTWQKRALVIGGSAGAGAGVGALIGGKKGALIGAAVGGGGAAIVDQIKH